MSPAQRAELIAIIRRWWHAPGYLVDFDDLVDAIGERFTIEEKP